MEENIIMLLELAKGTKLDGGKYVIESVIGVGGFGITYIAHHTVMGNNVAIKEFCINGKCVRNSRNLTIHIQGMSEEKFNIYRQKFIDEARTLEKLNHPGVVRVLDVFQENNTSYIVMPYIEGRTLQKIVEDNGRLDYPMAVNYIAQLGEAIDYIHKNNILHRDIKPDNIIVTPDEKIMLIDFGSAREFVNDKTQSHTSILTQGYAPLEQYSTISRKGSYTDIYAMGGVFYFVLTGEKPIDATSRTVETLKAPRELFADIPEAASRTVMKAMQLKVENRHQTVSDFMDDLLNRRPSKVVEESFGGGGNRRWLWWLAALIVVVGGVLVGVLSGKKPGTVEIDPYELFINGNVENATMISNRDHSLWYVRSSDGEIVYMVYGDVIDRRNVYRPGPVLEYTYTGQLQNGLPNGQGLRKGIDIDSSNGKAVAYEYSGKFVDGLASGLGTLTWEDGDYYQGNWRRDAPYGEGTLFFASNNNGKITGTWRARWDNGSLTHWVCKNKDGKYTVGNKNEWYD